MLSLVQVCKSNNQDVIEMQNPVLIQKQHSIKVYQYFIGITAVLKIVPYFQQLVTCNKYVQLPSEQILALRVTLNMNHCPIQMQMFKLSKHFFLAFNFLS